MKKHRLDYIVIGTLMWSSIPVPLMLILTLLGYMSLVNTATIWLTIWCALLAVCLFGLEGKGK